LSFDVTVTDVGGLRSRDEISITVEDNGIVDFPDDVISTTAFTGYDYGVRVENGGRCISLNSVDPSTIGDNQNRPGDLVYGLIDTRFRTDTVGGTVVVTFFLAAPAPEGYGWYKHNPGTGWYDYADYAVFNPSRDQVTITLIDGGIGDDDGVANGVIVDPAGLGTSLAAGESVSSSPRSSSSGSSGSIGCFISTVSKVGKRK
jgi:hypothetical protein